MAVSYGLHIAVVIGCISLFAWGCDGGATDHSSGTRRTPLALPAGYRVVDVVNGGTLSGSVLWIGPQPEVVMLPVEHHADACGEQQAVPALSVGPHGGVAGTVVYLDGITEGRAVEAGPFEVAFRGCALSPRVLAMPVGATLSVVDDEEVMHNFLATWGSGARWLDVGLAARGAHGSATAEHTGVATLVDDAGHPWVGGFVHVFDHPYYRVTTEDGRFRIIGIPPGQYTVRAWHEGVRRVGDGSDASGRPRMSAPLVLARPVALTSGTDTVVDFQLDLSAVEAAGD
jgi:hypothetical protein